MRRCWQDYTPYSFPPGSIQSGLVELDEQPTLDGVLPAQAASAEARARARIFE
jgi:hypothetical protein